MTFATDGNELEKEGGRAAAGMDPKRQLPQGETGSFFEEKDGIGPNNAWGYAGFIDNAVVVPRTCGALLIVERAVMVMDRGKNRAHAQVEQAKHCCD